MNTFFLFLVSIKSCIGIFCSPTDGAFADVPSPSDTGTGDSLITTTQYQQQRLSLLGSDDFQHSLGNLAISIVLHYKCFINQISELFWSSSIAGRKALQ